MFIAPHSILKLTLRFILLHIALQTDEWIAFIPVKPNHHIKLSTDQLYIVVLLALNIIFFSICAKIGATSQG